MKIIHIIYDSIGNPWLGGGGAERTHEMYKRISRNNKVIILTGNYPKAEKVIDGVEYKRVGFGSNYILSRISYLLFMPFYLLNSQGDIFVEDLGFPFPLVYTNMKKHVLASVQFIPNDS